MKKAMFRNLLLPVLMFPLDATAAPGYSHYLFVWAMESSHPHAADTAT